MSSADARHCPRCGPRGILLLDHANGEHGQIVDPVMLCPSCETEFTATGMTWLGAFDLANATDEELDALAEQIDDVFFGGEGSGSFGNDCGPFT